MSRILNFNPIHLASHVTGLTPLIHSGVQDFGTPRIKNKTSFPKAAAFVIAE